MTQENKDTLLTLLNQHRELGISEQIDYEKFYLYSLITHSTAIEGSTVTEVEAQLLFDEGITSSKRTMVEQMMNLDLKAAYEYGMKWIKLHEPITVDWLITLASKVMARTGSEYHSLGGDFDSSKGEIRKLNVTAGAGGRSYMSYMKVPMKLEAFCDELNRRRTSLDATDVAAIYDLSFWAHYELVTIHPWADGNGRTCRLLMNLLQMEYDVLPAKVLKEDKAEYIQALIDTREEEDINIFLNCMTKLHCQHLKHDIYQYTSSVADDVAVKETNVAVKETDVAVNVTVDLTDRQRHILNVIKNNVAVNTKYLAEQLAVNRKTIQRDLSVLTDNHLIHWIGSDKTGHWEIVKSEIDPQHVYHLTMVK